MLFDFGVVGLNSGKSESLGGLYIVVLIVSKERVPVSRYRVVVIRYTHIVIHKFIVFKLSSGVDFLVMVNSKFGAGIRMILLVFLVSVLRQVLFIFDQGSVASHVFRLYFDGSYLALPVTHWLQFEFNITILIIYIVFSLIKSAFFYKTIVHSYFAYFLSTLEILRSDGICYKISLALDRSK